MKNKLLGIALLLGVSSFTTFVTLTLGYNQVQGDFAFQDPENREEFAKIVSMNVSHGFIETLKDPEEAKKTKEEKDAEIARSAIEGRDCENKKKYQKQMSKVAPQEKFKCMEKKGEDAFKKEAKRQSNEPSGNGDKRPCDSPGKEATTASETYSSCQFSLVMLNNQATYEDFLRRRMRTVEAWNQDYCRDKPDLCQKSGDGTMIAKSRSALQYYKESVMIPSYEEEIAQSRAAVKEVSEEFLRADNDQVKHLQTLITKKGLEAELVRVNQAGGSSEGCPGTCKGPKKIHDDSSQQGGTSQVQQA